MITAAEARVLTESKDEDKLLAELDKAILGFDSLVYHIPLSILNPQTLFEKLQDLGYEIELPYDKPITGNHFWIKWGKKESEQT